MRAANWTLSLSRKASRETAGSDFLVPRPVGFYRRGVSDEDGLVDLLKDARRP
jgi:hypothetical protein